MHARQAPSTLAQGQACCSPPTTASREASGVSGTASSYLTRPCVALPGTPSQSSWPHVRGALAQVHKTAFFPQETTSLCHEQPAGSVSWSWAGGSWRSGRRSQEGISNQAAAAPGCAPTPRERAALVESAWQQGPPLPAEQTLRRWGSQCLLLEKRAGPTLRAATAMMSV